MAEAAMFTDNDRADHPVVETLNAAGRGAFVIACEHASNYIPAEFDSLGLSGETLRSHIAWDPGARDVAVLLSQQLDAPLVASTVSRLVYDCNRPPMDAGATPARSEIFDIPGNAALSMFEKRMRAEAFYSPFRAALSAAVDAAGRRVRTPVLVTIHSFTPVYFGQPRDVEIGVLHDADSRFADLLLDAMTGGGARYNVARNQPYGPADGVTHTLRDQALPRGLLNVMIEIRNDLIATPADQAEMAGLLASLLAEALARIDPQTATNSGNRPEGARHA